MPQTIAALDVEIRTGARLEPVLRAFEVLRGALDAHGHAWTDAERDALEHASCALAANLETERR